MKTARVHHAARWRGGAWPLGARAQQPGDAGLGFVDAGQADSDQRTSAAAFRNGLNEAGYVEGQNVPIEYRWADGNIDRLPALWLNSSSSSRRDRCSPATAAAAMQPKLRPRTIPIVFGVGEDPVNARPRRQPRPARRQHDGHQSSFDLRSAQAAGTPARIGAQGRSDCRAGQSGQHPELRKHADKTYRGGRPCTGTANPGPQRQHQERDRGRPSPSLVRDRADALVRRWRRALHRAARPIVDARGEPSRFPRRIPTARLSKLAG